MHNNFTIVSLAVQGLHNQLLAQRAKLSATIPAQHIGAKYKKVILRFVAGMNKLERDNAKTIKEVANSITVISQEVAPDELNRLWHRLALAITNISEHPTKPVATLLIDANNRLAAYGVNRIPRHVVKRPDYYVQSIRKHFIVCSERTCIADFHGHTIKKLRNNTHRDAITRERIAHFSTELIALSHKKNLAGMKIISTVTPCMECAEVITAHRPHAVYTGRGGSHFTRQGSFAAAQEYMASAAIKVWQLVS